MKIFKIKVDDTDLDNAFDVLDDVLDGVGGPDDVTDFLHEYNINLYKSSKYMDVYQCKNPNVDEIKNDNVLSRYLKKAYPNGVRFFERIASDGSHILEIECYKDTTIPDRPLSKMPGAVRVPVKAEVTPVNKYHQRKVINVNETSGKKDDRLEQLKSFENNFDGTKSNVDIRKQYDDFLDTLKYRSFRLTFEKNKTTMVFTDGKDPVDADLLEKQNKMIDLFIHNECTLITSVIVSAYKDLIYDTLEDYREREEREESKKRKERKESNSINCNYVFKKGITMDILNTYPFDDTEIKINKMGGNNTSKMSIMVCPRVKAVSKSESPLKFDPTRYMMFSNDIHNLLIKTFGGIGIRETTNPGITYFSTKRKSTVIVGPYSGPYLGKDNPVDKDDKDADIKTYHK